MILSVKEQDLLLADEAFIAHQCSMFLVGTGTVAKGVAYDIFFKYPSSDTYQNGYKHLLQPGDISVHPVSDTKTVINCYTQIYPGYSRMKEDTQEYRLKYLNDALDKILNLVSNNVVAFPFKYGCGLAGGNWSLYSKAFDSHPLKVVFYEKTT